MKRIILFLLFMGITTFVYAQDRVSVKVEFRKVLWICPIDGMEEIEDRNVSGGDSYEHTCKNGHTFNQSGSNMKEYNGCLSYPYSKFPMVKQKDIDTEKTKRMDDWIYEIKHPPIYQEPSKVDLENQKAELQKQIDELQVRIDAK